MKVFKEDSIVEKRMRELEDFMNRMGISINNYGSGLSINIKKLGEFPLYNNEHNLVTSFPRMFDDERIYIREDLIVDEQFKKFVEDFKENK